MGLKDKHVLVAVTGSISAYKACDLVQRLKDEGAQVRVIMTPSAAKLVHPNTFATLTGYKVPTDAWTGTDQGAMDHIDFARWADIFLVAPCTAHTLGELAQGLTGSLVSLAYLVFQGNAYIAPAMNSVMLDAPAVRRNLGLLRQKGDVILPTGEGVLACGEVGHGKLLDVAHIIAYLKTHRAFKTSLPDLTGRRVLLSLGHTREKWDDVRYLSNRSSGKTGLALARAFHLAGARVEIVAGAAEEAFPPGLVAAFAETSADFRKEMLDRQKDADVVIMSAAIADFVPAQVKKGKVKDSKSLKKMDLKPFPNILKELGERKRAGQILVGFALETKDALQHAKAKMEARNCDAMVVNNPVASETGFGKARVQAAVLRRGSKAKASLSEWDKDELAAAVVAEVAALIGNSMDALRNYLAWQGEMGGDEVILTAAPALRSAPAAVPGKAETALPEASLRNSAPPPPVSDKQEPAASDGLYQMLAKSLQGSESAAREKRSVNLGLPPADPSPRKPADPGVPTFGSHAEYRDHLEKTLPSFRTALPAVDGAVAGADGKLVHGTGPDFAPLALVALEPGPADFAAGRPFQGEGGALLEKMMRAIKLDLGQLYRTLVVKWAGPGRAWTRRDMVRLLPLLHAELALAKAPVVLLLGEACAQAVLKTGKSLEELRGAFHRVEGAPGREFAVTWHPDELEGKEELKRKAWKDLQWLQTRLQGD